MATQQNDNSGQSTLAISPSLIVGIVILAAFACIIIFASVFRYCRRSQSPLHDLEAFEETGETEFYNPNKPLSASQAARLKEVRWINNMYAWERGRRARMDVGELRPTTMILGRKGENKTWDDYSTVGDSSWQTGIGNGSSGSDESRAPYFYNLDDPYARSSQQRLSHLAPPTDQFRNSYQSTVSGNGNGYLPRHPSALLPPPTNSRRDAFSPVAQKSPLRNEYLFDGQGTDPSTVFDAGPRYVHHGPRVDSLRHIERRSPSPFVNPTITVSDESQAVAYMHSPAPVAYDANFETVTLDGHDQAARENEGVDMSQRSLPDRSTELADHRPSVVVVNDESYPQLQLQFLTQSLSQNSVSVYDDHQEEEEVGVCNGLNVQSSTHGAGTENGEHNAPLREMETDENVKGENENEILGRNVKGMIHQWEKANGSFGRSHLATP